MPRIHLTDMTVRTLKPDRVRPQTTYWDKSLRAFGCRITKSGTKSWVVMVGRNRRLITLARYPETSLKDARVLAHNALSEPAKPIEKATPFEDAVSLFVAAAKAKTRPRTYTGYERYLHRFFVPKFRRSPIREVETHQVMDIIDALIDVPIERLHVFNTVRTFFRFCVQRRLITTSPLQGIAAPGRFHKRTRVLNLDELRAVWRAACEDPTPFGPIVRLCILTGQRRGEIGQLRREWFNEKERVLVLPAGVCKNKVQHTLPYGQMVQDVLDTLPSHDGYLFPGRKYHKKKTNDDSRSFGGWARGKYNLDGRCPLAPWALHDLRRTFATTHAQIGTPIHVTERLLNHVSGTLGGIVSIYQQHSWFPQMQAAVEAYEAHLSSLFRAETRQAAE